MVPISARTVLIIPFLLLSVPFSVDAKRLLSAAPWAKQAAVAPLPSTQQLLPIANLVPEGNQYYRLRMEFNENVKDGANRVTLHGLWPAWAIDCDVATLIDTNAVARLDKIEEYMPGLASANQSQSNRKHWQHQYNKHGSCAVVGDAQGRRTDFRNYVTYFMEILRLYQAHHRHCTATNKKLYNGFHICDFCYRWGAGNKSDKVGLFLGLCNP